ncbi:glycosyl hydrolase family 18 protein [Aliikangiella coralliicola]|uniref:chitinase n=1 Tax=Aliikangiella coralliicola TaxID=2592383 RepID=A0A545UDP6_9GAMM|nr:glycosyl hydrolase family 18 protein [Aliikangiella coralliicola]TQV87584.1 PKD domain-containing protein [Aliikangiella coralliicola]
MKINSKRLFFVGGALFFFHSVLAQPAYAIDCSNLPEWNSSNIYTGGDQVQQSNKGYEAKWWSQGNSPETHSGQWQEWKNLGNCDGGDPDNKPPFANTNGPYAGKVNTDIAFSSSGSADNDGHIASYAWDFGDGNSSTQANPVHQYSREGSYAVKLVVTDNKGASASASTTANIERDGGGDDCDASQYSAGTRYESGDIVANVGRKYRCDIAGWCSSSAAWAYEPGVGAHWNSAWTDVGECDDTPKNKPPVANANGPYNAKVNENVSFSSAGSADPDGMIVSYHWDFGDGNSSSEANPVHAYARAGSYSVSLTATDDKGATSSATATVSISDDSGNESPVANANGPYSGREGDEISFSSAGSTDTDGSIVKYRWEFGDGGSSEMANPQHRYSAPGVFNASLTVTDNDGASHTDSATVTVSPKGNPGNGDKVVGYFTEWGVYDRNYHVKNIHTSGSAEKLTHIVYAFGNVVGGKCVMGDKYAAIEQQYDENGSVDGVADQWDAPLRGNFNQLLSLKKMYPHLKILWSFGGWTWSGGFGEAAANAESFANSCFDLVYDERWSGLFDGIDIDWEYPNACGQECDTSGYDSYPRLMGALRARFGDRLVTAAIGAGESKLNAADYGTASQYVDFYMLMTYDFFGAWDAKGPTAPHSPLYAYDGIPIREFNSDYAVKLLLSKGVSAEKVLLGIGFYGRGWTGVTQSEPGGSATGAAKGNGDYRILKNSCPATGLVGGTAYAKCGSDWWSYDTPATISGKMDYVKQQGMGGAFFWELGGDTDNGELIKAIKDNL